MKHPRHSPFPLISCTLHCNMMFLGLRNSWDQWLRNQSRMRNGHKAGGLLKFSMEPATEPPQNSTTNHCSPALQCGNACL